MEIKSKNVTWTLKISIEKSIFKLSYFVYGCFDACMSIYLMYTMSAEAKRGCQTLLKLTLKLVVSQHVGAGDQTWVLWKSSESSKLQSYLSCCKEEYFKEVKIIFAIYSVSK